MDVCRDPERKSADIKTAGMFRKGADLLFLRTIVCLG